MAASLLHDGKRAAPELRLVAARASCCVRFCRLCDASGGPECRGEARIAPCPAGEPWLAAAGTTPDGNGSSTGTAARAGGGSSTGATVGGVVGGIAAAAMALVLLLVWRRRRRRRQRRQALPIIVTEVSSCLPRMASRAVWQPYDVRRARCTKCHSCQCCVNMLPHEQVTRLARATPLLPACAGQVFSQPAAIRQGRPTNQQRPHVAAAAAAALSLCGAGS